MGKFSIVYTVFFQTNYLKQVVFIQILVNQGLSMESSERYYPNKNSVPSREKFAFVGGRGAIIPVELRF